MYISYYNVIFVVVLISLKFFKCKTMFKFKGLYWCTYNLYTHDKYTYILKWIQNHIFHLIKGSCKFVITQHTNIILSIGTFQKFNGNFLKYVIHFYSLNRSFNVYSNTSNITGSYNFVYSKNSIVHKGVKSSFFNLH
jgi:hypothetical protein